MIDEQVQLQQQYYKIDHPEIFCPSKNPIRHICTNSACKFPALKCGVDLCESCDKKHEECEQLKFTAFTSKLQRRASLHKEFITRVFKVQEEIICALRANRKEIIQKYRLIDLEEKYQQMAENIYKKNEIRGREAYELYLKLLENTVDMKTGYQSLLQQYAEKCKVITDSIVKERESVFHSYMNSIRQRQQAPFNTNHQPIERVQKRV